jgi:hypothetical protein
LGLFFAFAYNVLGVLVAAGVLYPFFEALLSPMIAAAALSLSSVSVIANALRLRRMQLSPGREDRRQGHPPPGVRQNQRRVPSRRPPSTAM